MRRPGVAIGLIGVAVVVLGLVVLIRLVGTSERSVDADQRSRTNRELITDIQQLRMATTISSAQSNFDSCVRDNIQDDQTADVYEARVRTDPGTRAFNRQLLEAAKRLHRGVDCGRIPAVVEARRQFGFTPAAWPRKARDR